jgi:hypothetical protein
MEVGADRAPTGTNGPSRGPSYFGS